jgi:subtilisin family serine protease
VKIAIIDSGIDNTHPAFQDSSLPVPEGFPRANNESDLAFTNNKVIVARSYAAYFLRSDPDRSPRDHFGHGTATAMCAAGVTNTGPLATITGMAPKAWIGNYKVFGSPGVNEGGSDDAILKAIDDAVADGMDVLSLSFGTNLVPRADDDPDVIALERAATFGVIIVVAAGNNGPDLSTMNSPAIAPSVLAVGASFNDRTFSTNAKVGDAAAVQAVPGNGRYGADAITAPIVDIERLDGTGLTCAPLPADSLKGSIAFILRGDCTFEAKLSNAQAAGAVGALVYTHKDEPEPSTMDVRAVTLPAEMISNADGLLIKRLLAGNSQLTATLQFVVGPAYVDPARLAGFSAKGPNQDYSIKPDLVAAGVNVYTAAQKLDTRGAVYSSTGYSIEQGTSFSTPIVAGAAALLKSARPGLTPAQYRSLLVNSAAPASLIPGTRARVQQSGAGVLDVAAALDLTVTAVPSTLSFGIQTDPAVTRTVTLSNIGTAAETYTLVASPSGSGPVPQISPSSVRLEAGSSVEVTVTMAGVGSSPGEYDGYIAIQGARGGAPARVPYWFAQPSGTVAGITVVEVPEDVSVGSSGTIYLKITDVGGIPLNDVDLVVTPVTVGATVTAVRSVNRLYPNLWSVSVRLSRTAVTSVFNVKAGNVERDISVTGN